MKKKIIAGVIIVALIAAFITLRIASVNKNKYTQVKTSLINKGNIEAYLSTTAVIESKNKKNYYGIQGKVKSVNVKLGDKVKSGDVLAAYETSDTSLAVKQAQLQYDNAVLLQQQQLNSRDQINQKVSDLNSQISALKNSKNPSDVTKVQQLQTQLNSTVPITDEQVKITQNNVQLAQATLDSAKNNAANSKDKIVADIDGTVTAVNIEAGAVSTANQAAFTVHDTDNLKAVVSVGKYDALKISLGEAAVIKNNGKEYNGKVSFINPAAEKTVSQTGSDTSLTVEIDISDKPDNLKIEFNTDIDIKLGEADNVLKVPSEAVLSDKTGKTYVYVAKGNKAVKKDITLGLQSDTYGEVKSGLNEGDKVILNPGSQLNDGTFIKEGKK